MTDYDIPREDEIGNPERRSRSNLQNRVKNTITMKQQAIKPSQLVHRLKSPKSAARKANKC